MRDVGHRGPPPQGVALTVVALVVALVAGCVLGLATSPDAGALSRKPPTSSSADGRPDAVPVTGVAMATDADVTSSLLSGYFSTPQSSTLQQCVGFMFSCPGAGNAGFQIRCSLDGCRFGYFLNQDDPLLAVDGGSFRAASAGDPETVYSCNGTNVPVSYEVVLTPSEILTDDEGFTVAQSITGTLHFSDSTAQCVSDFAFTVFREDL